MSSAFGLVGAYCSLARPESLDQTEFQSERNRAAARVESPKYSAVTSATGGGSAHAERSSLTKQVWLNSGRGREG